MLGAPPALFCALSKGEFCPANDMILKDHIKLVEIAAPSPYPDNEVGILFRMLLCIQQTVTVDGINLDLMTAQVNEGFDELCNFAFPVIITEYGIMNFDGKRAAIDDIAHIKFGE